MAAKKKPTEGIRRLFRGISVDAKAAGEPPVMLGSRRLTAAMGNTILVSI
jgi:hypothetical protein